MVSVVGARTENVPSDDEGFLQVDFVRVGGPPSHGIPYWVFLFKADASLGGGPSAFVRGHLDGFILPRRDGYMSQTVLITGASSGIGLELARLFAVDGYALVLVSRDARKLDDVAAELRTRFSVSVFVMPVDLSKPAGPAKVALFLKKKRIAVDVLVNNAGVGLHGAFEKTDWQRESDMIQLNVASLVELTKRLLPDLVARRGKILNVASTAAFQPGPYMSVYYASKAFVLSFSEALHEELLEKVSVTALCPGPTRTGFTKAARMGRTPLFDSAWVMDAQTVAKAGYSGLKRGKAVVVPGVVNRLLAESIRFTPRRVVRKLVKRLHPPKD